MYHNLNRSIIVIELIQWLTVSTAMVVPASILATQPSRRAFYYASYYSSVFFFNSNFHIDNFQHFFKVKDFKPPEKPEDPEQ